MSSEGRDYMDNIKEIPIKYVIIAVLGVIMLLSIVFANQIFGETSVFNDLISDNQAINDIYHNIPTVIRCAQILFLSWVVLKILQFVSTKTLSHSKGGITASKLINSFLKYIMAILAMMFILKAFGVNTAALIASAGILSLVIGLGAQSLIADIIAGMFMVFESEFQVGDMVVIDGWRGTVDEIGIRSTRIIDAGGNVKIVNNSNITSVVNQSQLYSVAMSTISIEYGESLQRVELVIRDNLDAIKAAIPEIVEGPYYKGVTALGASSVDLLFMSNCKEEDIYIVQRAMNRELKLLFDKNGINIPFPQVVVNTPHGFGDSIDVAQRRDANAFAAEQRTISKNVEENLN